MILLTSDSACAHCPNSMVCAAAKRIEGSFCVGCGAVIFDYKYERYLCLLLRRKFNQAWAGRVWSPPRTSARYDHTPAMYAANCLTRIVTHGPCAPAWVDCEDQYRKTNGYDEEY